MRERTQDERNGMRWWNALSVEDRAHWLKVAAALGPRDQVAGTSAADAWAAFKGSRAYREMNASEEE